MKNKKGFTLTEILATIVILGVILAIAVPSYNALSKKFEKEYYDKLEKTVLAAAKTYWKDNSDKRPNDYLESDNVNLYTLINGKYIDSIKKYKDKSKVQLSGSYNEGVVVTVKVEDGYDYQVCLNGFNNDNGYCNKAWKNNENISKCDANSCDIKPIFYLYYDENYQNTKENQEKLKKALAITPTYTKKDGDGKELKSISISDQRVYPKNITSITKKELGQKKLTYEESDIISTVEVFQYPAPTIKQSGSMVTLSLNDEITNLLGRKLADITTKETEFDRYQVSTDGGTWKDINNEKHAQTQIISYEEGTYKLKYRIVDSFENKGLPSDPVEFKVENKEATLEVNPILEGGAPYDSGTWTNKNITFYINATLVSEQQELKYSIDNKEKGTIQLNEDGTATISTNIKNNEFLKATYKFYITNTSLSKEIEVKIDKKPPTISVNMTKESGSTYNATKEYACGFLNLKTCEEEIWSNESIWLKANPADKESGVDKVVYKNGLSNIELTQEYNYSDLIDDYYKNGKIKVTVTDKAGNEATIEPKIYIDKISPYCSLSKENEQIVYSSHDWGFLGSGIASTNFSEKLTEESCKSLSFNTCYQIPTKNTSVSATVTDKAGNTYKCNVEIESSSPPQNQDLKPPVITLDKKSTADNPSTSDINFTLNNPNSQGTLKYSFDGTNWKSYDGKSTLLISATGKKTVYAKVIYNKQESKSSSETGYCNKDIATNDRAGNGYDKEKKGCWFKLYMKHNDKFEQDKNLVKNRYQYAYWKATPTTDKTNKYWGTSSYNNKLTKECGLKPPAGVKIIDSANSGTDKSGNVLTIKLYQEYSTQYYCFAIREYREPDNTGVNRWKVWYKNVDTSNECNKSAYNGG